MSWECRECKELMVDDYEYRLHTWLFPRHHPQLVVPQTNLK